MEIYFFAETPRAKSDHPAVVPVLHEVPVTIIEKYIPKVRKGETGSDFIGVCQPAPRKRLEKIDTSTETLVVAVPDYDLNSATNKEKIREKLKSFLGQIETIHDWSNETRSVVSLQIFDQWYNEIVSLIPKKLKPINSNGKKGNWFMRHKFLCAVVVLLLFVVSSVTLIGQPITDLFERLKIPTRLNNREPSPQAKALQTWLTMLGEKTDSTNEQFLQQQLHHKLQPLLKLSATQNNLQTILNNLKRCFDSGKDKLPTEQQSLDTLLDDGNLRAGVAKLFPNGNFNPIVLADRKDEKTLWYNFNENKTTIDSRLQKQRDLIAAAIEVHDAAQNEKVKLENDDNDKWIRFAKNLSFMKDGKDVAVAWQEVIKSKPQFVTQSEIDISHKIHEWLTGDDAKAVLQGEPPNNFIEALQRFGDEKREMKFYRFIAELGEKKQEEIADNFLKPEYKKLKDAWKQFQQQCQKASEP